MYQTNSPILSSNLQSSSNAVTESWYHSDWMGPCRVSSPISCSKQGQPRIQIRFLRALSTWVLKTCKDRRVHNPSGPLSQSLITLLLNLFFLVSRQILPTSNLSCRCGPQFVLSHLLFCLGRFGNNAKIRQAAVEKIRTLKLDYYRD